MTRAMSAALAATGIALAVAAANLDTAEAARMNETTTYLAERLAAVAATGRLDGLTLEYWKGGGLPPPLYRSEQLRVMMAGGREVVEFANMFFDKNYKPDTLHEKWTVAATPEELRALARAMLDVHVLDGDFAESVNPGVADAFSYEIIVTANGREDKRVFYKSLPSSLVNLGRLFDAMIARAKAQSPRTVFHQGRQIQ